MDDILNLPEFSGFGQYLMLGADVPRDMRLCEMGDHYPGWNGTAMAESARYLRDRVREGLKVDYDFGGEAGETGFLYLPGEADRPFVILCAGGGYESVCSLVEALPAAKRINELGFTAFILTYRVGETDLFPQPLEDLAKAVDYIIQHAAQFRVCKTDYAAAGFSAGGHLCGIWGTDMGCVRYQMPKPAALFLAYAPMDLSTMTRNERDAAFLTRILGTEQTRERMDAYSVNCHVNEDYPPVYLWQCKDDPAVPFSNSLCLVKALDKYHIPYRFRPVEQGGHSLGAADGTQAEGWLDEAVDFWKEQWKQKGENK